MRAKQRRLITNYIALGFSILSALAGIAFLFWILWVLVSNGINALNLNIFRFDGAPPGFDESGLRHALVGQLYDPDTARLVQKGMEYDPAPPYQAAV